MMTSPTNLVPGRSRDRVIDIALTINAALHGEWTASQMRLAAGKISTGVCTPAEQHMIEARLAVLRSDSSSPHIRELAADALHYLGEIGHG